MKNDKKRLKSTTEDFAKSLCHTAMPASIWVEMGNVKAPSAVANQRAEAPILSNPIRNVFFSFGGIINILFL